MHGDVCSSLLTEQYRMNSLIMQWASSELYESKLIAHPSVAGHCLMDLKGIKQEQADSIPVLLLIDTAGCDYEEIIGDDGVSRANPREAEVYKAMCLIHSEFYVSIVICALIVFSVNGKQTKYCIPS